MLQAHCKSFSLARNYNLSVNPLQTSSLLSERSGFKNQACCKSFSCEKSLKGNVSLWNATNICHLLPCSYSRIMSIQFWKEYVELGASTSWWELKWKVKLYGVTDRNISFFNQEIFIEGPAIKPCLYEEVLFHPFGKTIPFLL